MKIKKILQDFFNEEQLQGQEQKPSLLHRFVRMYIICWLISVVLVFGYAEIGHARGWERAERWHTFLHTYKFIPW